MRSRLLFAALALTGCSYFQSGAATEPAPATTTKTTTARKPGAGVMVTSSASLIKAMHDRYDGKYLKTMSFLQNNTQYRTTGEDQDPVVRAH